jgi:PAS domain S-box-containing protein
MGADRIQGDAWVADIMDRLGIAVFRMSRAGRFEAANAATARLLGFSSAEAAIGSDVMDHYTDPREREEAFARLAPIAMQQGRVRFEARRVRRDNGQPINLVMTLAPVLDQEGALRALDVMAEEAGERGVDPAFRGGQERFRVLFETSAVGIALATPEGRILRVNQALSLFLGLAEDKLVGRGVIDLVSSTDRKAARAWVQDDGNGDGGDRRIGPGPEEWRFVRPDGTEAWGAVSQSWLRADDQPHTRVLFVADVTKRRRMEEAVLRREKLEAVGLLAGGVAHDFNNILTVIRGHLELAAEDQRLADGSRGHMLAAQQAVERARALAHQLMTFARGGNPARKVISVAEVARETGALILCGTGFRLEVEAAPDLPSCEADPGQLGQVFHNLYQNAVEATPGGGTIRVRINAERVSDGTYLGLAPGEYLQVEVEDHGAGMPAAVLERVFDPYFSTKSRGSGLGLAIVQSVIQRHEGHVFIRSRPGFGTRVTFLLPTSCRPVEAAPLALTANAATAPVRERVLVMDDDADVLHLEQVILERAGLEVCGVSSGEAALDKFAAAQLEGEPFALAVLDLTVAGGMGGVETLTRLRGLAPDLRAVVCSGYSTDPVVADHSAYGFSGVVAKPFTASELREQVLKALSGRGAAQ